MEKSIAKNLMYNLSLQLVTMVLPLITVPYVSRILGAEGIGIYSYTLSISQYFILIGSLGLSIYGNRQIACTRDVTEKMSKNFWSILILRLLTTSIATVLYLLIFTRTQNYREIFLIQTLNIVAAMVDISWLYMGLEDFKKTVTRNLAVKIIGVCFIFIFIKSQDDLILYVFINLLMILIGNIILWVYLPKTVIKVKVTINDLLIHIIPSIKLFIPQIAIQIYVVLDKTMIGVLSNVTEVGYFEQSEKIVKAVLALVTALGIVMLPRMSNLFAKGEKEKMDNYLNNSLIGVAYVAIPLTFGLIGISNEFVPLFFGNGFKPAKYIMVMLSPILFFIAMSNVMGTQYLLPSNRTKEFTISVTAGAIINFISNLILIPKYNALGACIGTVASEISVATIQYALLRKEINIKNYLNALVKYLVAGLIMLLVVRLIGITMGFRIITIVIQIIVGALIYVLVLTILKEKVSKALFNNLFNLLHKPKFSN